MSRHLRLVAEGGNLVEPQPAQPTPKIEVDEALVDLAINLLDLLLAARETHSLGASHQEVSTPGHLAIITTPTERNGVEQ